MVNDSGCPLVVWSYPPLQSWALLLSLVHPVFLPWLHFAPQNSPFFPLPFYPTPSIYKKKFCRMASPDATSRCATAKSPRCRKGWPTTSQGPTWRCGRRLATARTWPSPVPGRCWPSCASPRPWSVVSGDLRLLRCAGVCLIQNW